jgi:recombinational DNA repair protein RecT
LEPNEPGGIWIVPFEIELKEKKRKMMVATPITDYRGLLDVARRSGEVAGVHADIRREKDEWEYGIDTALSMMVRLRHAPADGERGEIVGAYFVARLQSGQTHACYLSKSEIERYRARSKNAKSGFSPWKNDWEAMAKKTAVRRGINLLPRTPEIQELRRVLAEEERRDTIDSPVDADDMMPKRRSELAAKPSPSPSPAPVAEADDADDELPEDFDRSSDDETRAHILNLTTGPHGAQVTIEGGVVYTATEEFMPALQDAKDQNREVWLIVESGAIVEMGLVD